MNDPYERINYLREQIKAENISYGELEELQNLVDYIPEWDTQLREWAGLPE